MKHLFISIALTLFIVACTPNLPSVQETKIMQVNDGTIVQFEATPVNKVINGTTYQFFSYNRQIPAPILRVQQNSTIMVNFTNHLPVETTIHWHGLRQDFRNDGVPGVSQEPVRPGESFLYTLRFPDEGVFWYHPHMREDMQQDLGLYGNIIVEPIENHYNSVDKEEFIVVDDILIENNKIVSYGKIDANFALMGRYGNILLVNGKENYSLTVNQGATVRFYMTSVANVRPFNISIENTSLKMVGGDIGRYEQEWLTESSVIAPAERYIFEATFEKAGKYALKNINLWQEYTLGYITVLEHEENNTNPTLHNNSDVINDIDQYRKYFDKNPDISIRLGIEPKEAHNIAEMHSLTSIEWEDTMQETNKETTSADVTWFLEDNSTKSRNMNISYVFQQGEVKKIRIVNDKNSPHPMQHPIHWHGQRFLVIEQDGIKNTNLVWKDTVLVPAGSYVDILLDASNPGIWMMHCHIAEHLTSGMMGSFMVVPKNGTIPQPIMEKENH